MSLYNMLFGMNEDVPVLLGMLSVNMEYFDRFRDVYLVENGKNIRVYARIGGKNREEHKETWEKIRKHTYYLKDYDDDLDETYSYIDFSIPEEYIGTAKFMFKEEPETVKDKFNKEISEMDNEGSPASKRAEEIADRIIQALERGEKFIGF